MTPTWTLWMTFSCKNSLHKPLNLRSTPLMMCSLLAADLAPFGAGASQEFSSGAADFASSDSPRRARQSSSSLAESSSQARQVQVPVSLRTSSSVLDQQRLAAEIEEKVNEAMRETDSRKRKNDSPDGGDAQRQRVEDNENEDGMDRLEKR